MLLPVRPLFLTGLAALALISTPAHAGRASACKAPPFAVPKETQRAVDAAIEARVVGTGAGAVSTSVETRTDYETTMFSQDAVAKAWFEYTLCAKLARKMISQELHDELLRGLIAPATSADRNAPTVQAAGAAHPADADEPSPDLASLVGTWNVVSQFQAGSCPDGITGGKSAYIWLMSVAPDGGVVVDVQGQTSYDVLHGTYADGRLRVGAPVNTAGEPVAKVIATTDEGTQIALLPRSDFDLRVSGDALIGQRTAAMWGSTLTEAGQTLTILPCVLVYDVRATR